MQEFHAFEVQPGKDHTLTLPPLHGFHLSVVSIPHAGKGRGTLYVTVDGKSYAIATLDASQGILQNATDLIFNEAQKVIFRAKGNTPLHCCGYQQELDAGFHDAEDSDGSGEDDLNAVPMSDEEDEEEDMAAHDPTQAPQNGYHGDEEDDESDEEGEEDEEEDEEEMDDDDMQPVKRARREETSQTQRKPQQAQNPQDRPSNQQKPQQTQSPQGRPSNQQKRGRD